MKSWETDVAGWKTLTLPRGWIFVIDPDVRANGGYDVYLLEQREVLNRGHLLTTHGSLHHAMRMCEKLLKSGGWKKYTVKKPKESIWHAVSSLFDISPTMRRFFTTWSKRSVALVKPLKKL